ncbi:hypothetical protein [Sediminibacterium sp. TEGAF015]|uniref:hypothetical protein n=1 Tax=Sediminibacterium sp. TEGAF015 TaxID=575378 RepID=UPI0021FE09FC|nr:hypothetical protein [Sediminibacterium sp. TEGAF015]BDQ10833.1 hypothetical protein TEGAF0_00500 [Sediminibacterium sp. TEGAF015]
MKKIISLAVFALALSVGSVQAQGMGQMDPAQMLEMMKQRVKPSLIEKTKLTDAQADKVLEIQLWSQGEMRGMRDMSEEERATKMKTVNDEKTKKFKAIPLTDDQIKAVNDFYEEMRKNRPQRGGGGSK